MESVLTPPSAFYFDKNASDAGSIHEKWIKWKRSYEIYSKACEISNKSVEIQANILLHVVGEQCREVLDRWPEKCTTVEYIWKKLDEQFQTKKNLTVERHKFFIRDQRDNESIEQYVFELSKLAQNCEFRDLQEELIKDRLVCGVTSAAIRERLLREDDLTLKKALDICRAAVASRTYSENIKPEREETYHTHQIKQTQNDVLQIRSKMTSSRGRTRSEVRDAAEHRRSEDRGAGSRGPRAAVLPPRARPLAAGASQRRAAPGATKLCGYCGCVHKKFECPAYGQKCNRCFRKNHFSRVCGVNYIENSDDEDSQASG
ncbi:uncharacterized protein LOC128199740 [Bicyclus anynana]|uniref:Uncharacterized protein LOC128198791 n=2 Tax=Bicyclus anynana TaxID=110368 RepID=A0ABM3M6Q2_BICAN|nr:uncharacterized protein LOC128198791 [Bicyclus anynana]XP_052743664.1 uncharacterized protein LOC128199211 [Bicyclus anynana]XP_052746747.1 uncharacterized protein LOC128199740 [Bicyclus anynana]